MKKLLGILVLGLLLSGNANADEPLELICTSDDKSDWNNIYIDTNTNIAFWGNRPVKLNWNDSSYQFVYVHKDSVNNLTENFTIKRHDGRYMHLLYSDDTTDMLTIHGTCEKKKKKF